MSDKLPRLSAATAGRLAPEVQRPGYERSRVDRGIVHLGVGAFMRAHIAVYCDDMLANGDTDWGIAGVSLRKPDVYQQLAPQDCLYTVGIMSADDQQYRLIGSIKSIAVAPRDPARIVALIASPATKIVSITVTEKGYCLASSDGRLDRTNPDIVNDLKGNSPKSLTGFLFAGLSERRERNGGPVTLMSCDNLPSNGELLERSLREFAEAADETLLEWIDQNVTFPATMVDRIVPATTDEDVETASEQIGVLDRAYVGTEAFTQWVIEDRFANGRPAWEKAGALLVEDVAPYEAAKLRLLNGAHSTIAYLGYLAGYRFVHEVMGDADLATFVESMMRTEISPVTPEPAGMEHDAYISDLLSRFSNPGLNHRTWQIAMDGSQKLPQRLLATLREQLDAGGPTAALTIAIAAWMRYVTGVDDAGEPIDVSDPLAERFSALSGEAKGNSSDIVNGLMGIKQVFGDDLPQNEPLVDRLVGTVEALTRHGVKATVQEFLAGARVE